MNINHHKQTQNGKFKEAFTPSLMYITCSSAYTYYISENSCKGFKSSFKIYPGNDFHKNYLN